MWVWKSKGQKWKVASLAIIPSDPLEKSVFLISATLSFMGLEVLVPRSTRFLQETQEESLGRSKLWLTSAYLHHSYRALVCYEAREEVTTLARSSLLWLSGGGSYLGSSWPWLKAEFLLGNYPGLKRPASLKTMPLCPLGAAHNQWVADPRIQCLSFLASVWNSFEGSSQLLWDWLKLLLWLHHHSVCPYPALLPWLCHWWGSKEPPIYQLCGNLHLRSVSQGSRTQLHGSETCPINIWK